MELGSICCRADGFPPDDVRSLMKASIQLNDHSSVGFPREVLLTFFSPTFFVWLPEAAWFFVAPAKCLITPESDKAPKSSFAGRMSQSPSLPMEQGWPRPHLNGKASGTSRVS